MTYCVAIRVNEGLVLLSDTRTNSGIDSISKFKKMFVWEKADDRCLVLMTAGNLSVTQSVITRLQEQIDDETFHGDTLMTAPSLYRVAECLASAMSEVMNKYAVGIQNAGESAQASIILAGQLRDEEPRLFMIYSAGNFVEATDDTTFFQIGGFKYGKPILDRTIVPETPIEDAKTAALLSMDSTLRSNLAVGMPLDICVIRTGDFSFSEYRRIEADDKDFHRLSMAWSTAIREAFVSMRELPK